MNIEATFEAARELVDGGEFFVDAIDIVTSEDAVLRSEIFCILKSHVMPILYARGYGIGFMDNREIVEMWEALFPTVVDGLDMFDVVIANLD